jgi:hypothetical protein
LQSADTVTERPGHRGAAGSLAAAGAAVGVALLIVGCGGASPSPGVAKIAGSQIAASQSTAPPAAGGSGSASSASSGAGGVTHGFAIGGEDRQGALKLSACMRANGVPNFPDPNSQGVIQGTGIDPGSASFQSAQKKCAKYAPHGGQPPNPAQQAQAQAQALKFSACMRAHGEPSFPDPQFSTGGSIRISIHAGPGTAGSALDPSSPIFQAAQKACGSILPGKADAGPPPGEGGGKGA